MLIKTFEAPTVHEAMSLAQQELGEEAVVLNTKHVKTGGLLGIHGTSRVELMAAVDELASAAPPRRKTRKRAAAKPVEQECVAFGETSPPTPPRRGEGRVPPPASGGGQGVGSAFLPAPEAPALIGSGLEVDVRLLRAEVSNLGAVVAGLLGLRDSAVEPYRPLLARLGVDDDLARGELAELAQIDDPESLASALALRMQAFALPPCLDERQVIALVGPTGVGKTTTLAKLAARFALEWGKKVALVTADTYRIGAVEQLRTYARIMGLPLEIALSPAEVAEGVAKHEEADVVLIDTVGRSQRNEDHLHELKAFVDAASPTETHLVVAASLSGEIQRDVVERFAIFSPTRLAITKIDESANRGCLVNLPLRTGLGISCLTAGQNVPQDIVLADAGRIARLVTEVA